jgi:hypothetical protein
VYCHHVHVDRSASQAASWRNAPTVCFTVGLDARRAVFVLTRSSACARCDVSVKTTMPYNSEPPMSAIRGVVSTIVLGSTTTPNDFVARC